MRVRILHPLPRERPGIVKVPGFFFAFFQKTASKSCGVVSPAGAIPLRLPLTGPKGLYVSLHPYGAVLLHLLRNVPVNVQSKGGGGVAEIVLDRF